MLAEEILDRLQILPIDSLKIHEQTLPANERNLRENMLNLGRIVDPIVVDNKHHVVLDGNHRRAVLASLKTEYAVCQVVDYDSPEIRIGGWYLATKTLPLSRMGKGEQVDFATGQAAIDKMTAAFMLVSRKDKKDACTLFPSSAPKLGTVIEDQRRLLDALKVKKDGEEEGNGPTADLQFVEDSRLDYILDNGYSVLVRRNFTKSEVITEASAGRPLPPKSTRHMIPNRIIRLNFHLGYLNESPETAWSVLSESVRKRVRYGSARYYTEPVIVLY
ncbi:Uncharacterised protein [uncultured archaeon]|nr:Uncharacterised protein [uncultured archaeon]